MTETKTQVIEASVADYLNTLTNEVLRAGCVALPQLMTAATG